MKALIESLFGYCPLIWIFHSGVFNNKINHLHELLLGIICKGQDLGKRDKSFTTHEGNIQLLFIKK